MHNSENQQFKISRVLMALLFFFAGLITMYYSPYFSPQRSSQAQDLSLFWNVWNTMEEKYPFQEPNDKDKIYSAIEGLVESYDDEYSLFLPPQETEFFTQTVEGTFAGVGAEIGLREGYLTVIAPLKGSPAESAGLLPGDIITYVDDIDIAGETLDQAIGRIRGEINTPVILTVLRRDELEPLDIEIIRDTVIIPVTETDIIDEVFVIHLYNFNDNAESEFKRALEEFKQSDLDKLLIDVRNNPGGFLSAAIDISSYFLPQGTVVLKETFGDTQEDVIHRSYGHDLLTAVPDIMVLQNTGSASASEIIAGALRDAGVAQVVGETSYGKGSVQQLIDLPQNTALKVTIAQWLTPNGNQISETGVIPDIEILPDYESEEDTQLQEAINIFNQE